MIAFQHYCGFYDNSCLFFDGFYVFDYCIGNPRFMLFCFVINKQVVFHGLFYKFNSSLPESRFAIYVSTEAGVVRVVRVRPKIYS